jgi:hypothetical protein
VGEIICSTKGKIKYMNNQLSETNVMQFDDTLVPNTQEADRLFWNTWNAEVSRFNPQAISVGRKPKVSAVQQFKILMANLHAAWILDPEYGVRVPLSTNAFVGFENVSYVLVNIIRLVHGQGLITYERGVRGKGNTCIYPTDRLIALFQSLEDL